MSIAVKSFGVYLKKEPLPLKKSFDLINENDLAPYKVLSKHKIENEEIISALGTEDYIQWVLEDIEAADNSPVEKIMLFITYYQLPDRVPKAFQASSGSGKLSAKESGVEMACPSACAATPPSTTPG